MMGLGFMKRRARVGILLLSFLTLQQQPQQVSSQVFGGELMAFATEAFDTETIHRQDICHKYEAFRNGDLVLRYALEGLELKPVVMDDGNFFHYDYETGIDALNPGLLAVILDEVARRGRFTWRQSFDFMEPPWSLANWTFTDLLVWSIDTYDIAISRWDLSIDRMERGVAYMTPWFDGSVVLVTEENEPEKEVYLFGLFRPFDRGVWVLAWVTILVSGIVHQILEYWNNERQDRSMWQWFRDSHYLSILNATQNYEYAPNSSALRVYGVSMAMWSLVMTATYTANLASLLVEQRSVGILVDTIEKAAVLGVPICTHANTNADIIIQNEFEKAIRVPKPSELEAYEALRTGECGVVAGQLDSWLGYEVDSRYNPDCDMAWVGREVEVVKSGFATKADAGNYCSSFIRDVFNLHLTEMSKDGFLEEAWEKHRAKAAEKYPSQCDGDGELDASDLSSGLYANRFLRQQPKRHHSVTAQARRPWRTSTTSYTSSTRSSNTRRKLKGGGNSASAAGTDSETESLSVAQMSGVFVLHYCIMVSALLIGAADRYYNRYRPEKRSDDTEDTGGDKRASLSQFGGQMKSFRPNGPIIGSPPPVNTYYRGSTSKRLGMDCAIVEEESTVIEDPSEMATTETPLGDINYSFQNLQSDVRVSKRKIALTQQHTSEIRAQQQEMANQMNMMMGMLQAVYKQNGGTADVNSFPFDEDVGNQSFKEQEKDHFE